MLEYKGYKAKVEYDNDAKILYGKVIGLKDIIDFQTDDIELIEEEFQKSVDDYLEFCSSRNEEPDRPYSGKFVFRTNPDIHRQIVQFAQYEDISINQLLENAIINHINSNDNNLTRT